jgi:hypothetical protein
MFHGLKLFRIFRKLHRVIEILFINSKMNRVDFITLSIFNKNVDYYYFIFI